MPAYPRTSNGCTIPQTVYELTIPIIAKTTIADTNSPVALLAPALIYS